MSRRRGRSDDSPISLFSFQDIITSVSGIMIFIVLLLSLELTSSSSAPLETEGFEVAEELRDLAAEREERRASLQERRRELLEINDRLAELEALDWDNINALVREAEQRAARLKEAILAAQAGLEASIEEAAAATGSSVENTQALIELLAQQEKLTQALVAAKEQKRLALIPEKETGKRAILVEWDSGRIGVKLLGKARVEQTFQLDATGRGEFREWLSGRDRRLEYCVLLVKPSGFSSFTEMRDIVIGAGFNVGWEPVGAGQTGVF